MGIEDFLNDLQQNRERNKETDLRQKDEKKKQKIENENYLGDFQKHYEQIIIPEFKKIQEKLQPEFSMNYDKEPNSDQGAYFYTSNFIPKFEHFYKRVDVKIIAEGRPRNENEDRLISLSGTKIRGRGDKMIEDSDGLHLFQVSLEEFKKVDLENAVTEILNKVYLKK